MRIDAAGSRFLVLALVALLAGCGGGDGEGDDPAAEAVASGGDAGEVRTHPDEGPAYRSSEGEFTAHWPDGCEHVRVRQKTDDSGRVETVFTSCDREGRENEGCSIISYFALRDENGGPPNPQTVIARVKEVMDSFQVDMESQTPVRRGEVQGVQVMCRERGSTGTVWIEGLLAGGRVYILTAWRGDGDLFEDRDYRKFFETFRPLES